MSNLKLTPSLLAMLERIERHSGSLLMLAVTASGAQEGKLNKLRSAEYVVKCDHPSVTEGDWHAEALAITEAGRTALANHRAELAKKKRRNQRGLKSDNDKRVVFRSDGERYIVFLGDDDRIGFVRRADNGKFRRFRRWPIPATQRPDNGRVSYCAVASSKWFDKVRSEGRCGTPSPNH